MSRHYRKKALIKKKKDALRRANYRERRRAYRERRKSDREALLYNIMPEWKPFQAYSEDGQLFGNDDPLDPEILYEFGNV